MINQVHGIKRVCERRKLLYMTELGKAQRRRARVIEEERGKKSNSAHIFIGETITKIMGKNQTYAHTRIRRKQFPSFTMFKSVEQPPNYS